MKIGILKEGKTPEDNRVVLTPSHIRSALDQFPDLNIVVQPSATRCFSDEEYSSLNIELQEDLGDCDVVIGVKEVLIDWLMNDKTYFFFSHTIKEQSYNRDLLRAVLKKQIRLIDYECLKDDKGIRVIAFGRWAGIVGAHNGLYTWGQRSGAFSLKRAKDCKDYEALIQSYRGVQWPPIKILTTGNGRVARGANELLENAGIRKVNPQDYLNKDFDEAVFTNVDCDLLYARKSDGGFDWQEFFSKPEIYRSTFEPYTKVTDLFINSIYWDPQAPAYFSVKDMESESFHIQAIADITCDIAPDSSIPSTIRPSTIADPIYGFDPATGKETNAHSPKVIDVMAVDNLPNELARDASTSFGDLFMEHVMPELIREKSAFLDRATIAWQGRLNGPFEYLQGYVDGK